MPGYYRGNRYKFYRRPHRSAKRVRQVSDRVYWSIMAVLMLIVIVSLYLTYNFFIG